MRPLVATRFCQSARGAIGTRRMTSGSRAADAGLAEAAARRRWHAAGASRTGDRHWHEDTRPAHESAMPAAPAARTTATAIVPPALVAAVAEKQEHAAQEDQRHGFGFAKHGGFIRRPRRRRGRCR